MTMIDVRTSEEQYARQYGGPIHLPRPNVAGLLRAGADTVKFSLARKSSQ